MSVTCSARVPVGDGAVRAVQCSAANGRSQSSPGEEGARRFQRRVAVGLHSEVEVGRSSLALVRSSCSSKESIDGTSSVEALRYAPTAAVGRARSAGARGSGWASLSLASFAEDEELLLGARDKILKATHLPEGEPLGHLGRSTQTWMYRGQWELRALLFQQRDMRKRQLEEMWSMVLAGRKRILWVTSVGSCSWKVRRVHQEWV